VDGLGEDLLAHAGLAEEDHADGALGDELREPIEPLHRGVLDDHLAASMRRHRSGRGLREAPVARGARLVVARRHRRLLHGGARAVRVAALHEQHRRADLHDGAGLHLHDLGLA